MKYDEQIILGHTIIHSNYSVKVKQYITKKINNCGFKKMASAGESRTLLLGLVNAGKNNARAEKYESMSQRTLSL